MFSFKFSDFQSLSNVHSEKNDSFQEKPPLFKNKPKKSIFGNLNQLIFDHTNSKEEFKQEEEEEKKEDLDPHVEK